MDNIDDDAIDRVYDEIGFDEMWDYNKTKMKIENRFPGWSDKRKSGFATKIMERTAFKKSPAGFREDIVSQRTTLSGSGFGAKRTVMIRDMSGKYAGRRENLKIYSRHGNVYFRNIKSGKKGRLN